MVVFLQGWLARFLHLRLPESRTKATMQTMSDNVGLAQVCMRNQARRAASKLVVASLAWPRGDPPTPSSGNITTTLEKRLAHAFSTVQGVLAVEKP